MTSRSFRIGDRDFLLDGSPHRVIAGALHYFRVHPDQWSSRIRAARLMGLNTIETYVPWNEHEPAPGEFRADGALDLRRFLTAVHDEGMQAIVRPGPYICAEWDGGGLPAWLFRDGDVGVRTAEPRFLAAVGGYLDRVLDIVAPLQIDRGGPVVLLQVENEYGAYGDISTAAREEYLRALVDIYRRAGITVPLTTVDQPTDAMLAAGSIDGLHRTGSFGGRSAERLETLRRHQPSGPLMCSEFWCGWFDHWGDFHHTGGTADAARELDEMLAAGASVNIYMFHGGTNFGLTNGANDKGVYQPTVTSYDYDAPLDEAGRPTEKYWAFREVISRYASVPDIDEGMLPPPLDPAPAPVALTRVAAWHAALAQGTWHESVDVPTMDALGCFRGMMLYRTTLDLGDAPAVLDLGEVRDRAQVFLDGAPVGVLARSRHEHALTLPRGRGELTVLVEDQGRVNYGARIGEHKGLIGPVRLDGAAVTGWRALPVPLAEIPVAARHAEPDGIRADTPAVLRARVDLPAPRDLVIDTAGLGRGLVWIGETCLGRFSEEGPQRSLFVPAPLTRAGENIVTVLETGTPTTDELRFADALLLGPVEL